MSEGFRARYAVGGPSTYYQQNADDYRNPHRAAIVDGLGHAVTFWSSQARPDGIDFSVVLDLAAGGGEATLALWQHLPNAQILACDPYTADLYHRQTGQACAAISFEDIALGRAVLPSVRCIVCSCALHLAGESWLPSLCLALAGSARDLLVLTPLTRPVIRPAWGWQSMTSITCTAEERSLRLRWYRSLLNADANPAER